MFDKPNYTQIPNRFMDELLATLNNCELRVLLSIMRKTFGWNKERDRISLSQIQKMTGLSHQGVIDGLYGKDGTDSGLIPRRLITVFESKLGNEYLVNVVDQSDPEVVNVVDQGSQRGLLEVVNVVDLQKKLSKETIQKKEYLLSGKPDPTPVTTIDNQVLEYFNLKSGKRFRTLKGCGLSTILRLGYTMNDIKSVIDKKVRQWGNDAKMQEYLRPSTIFAPRNFESYLNSTELTKRQEGYTPEERMAIIEGLEESDKNTEPINLMQ